MTTLDRRLDKLAEHFTPRLTQEFVDRAIAALETDPNADQVDGNTFIWNIGLDDEAEGPANLAHLAVVVRSITNRAALRHLMNPQRTARRSIAKKSSKPFSFPYLHKTTSPSR